MSPFGPRTNGVVSLPDDSVVGLDCQAHDVRGLFREMKKLKGRIWSRTPFGWPYAYLRHERDRQRPPARNALHAFLRDWDILFYYLPLGWLGLAQAELESKGFPEIAAEFLAHAQPDVRRCVRKALCHESSIVLSRARLYGEAMRRTS